MQSPWGRMSRSVFHDVRPFEEDPVGGGEEEVGWSCEVYLNLKRFGLTIQPSDLVSPTRRSANSN